MFGSDIRLDSEFLLESQEDVIGEVNANARDRDRAYRCFPPKFCATSVRAEDNWSNIMPNRVEGDEAPRRENAELAPTAPS